MNNLLISGPTASGKTALALKLANDLNGEILSIDSVQIYTGCNVGSAKPSPSELAAIKHHLIDICSPNQLWNVADFIRESNLALSNIKRENRQPIFCGGTTMYISALFGRFDPLPAADPAFRERCKTLDLTTLHRELEVVDPVTAARISINDRFRIVRAIEVFRSSGVPLSQFLKAEQPPSLTALLVVLVPPREKLARLIELRTNQMLKSGLLVETESLLSQFGKEIRALATVGYFEAVQYLSGELTEQQLPIAIATSTRQLAKRQLTYWRNEPRKRGWKVSPDTEQIVASVEESTGRKSSKRNRLATKMTTYAWDYPTLLKRIEERLKAPLTSSEVWFVSNEGLP